MDIVDQKILRFFTKISHKFQILTGRTNYFLAKICLFFAMTSLVIKACNYWLNFLGVRRTDLFDVVGGGLLVVAYSRYIYQLDRADERVFSDSNQKTKPFFAMNTQFWRMMFLMMAILDIVKFYIFVQDKSGFFLFKFIANFWGTAMFLTLYFMTVDPLPPGKSKIREFMESFSAGFKQLAPVTRPQK